jgi:hypothetical protein
MTEDEALRRARAETRRASMSGSSARLRLRRKREQRHANGAPMFDESGMMLDDQGNRSIFDDVDE